MDDTGDGRGKGGRTNPVTGPAQGAPGDGATAPQADEGAAGDRRHGRRRHEREPSPDKPAPERARQRNGGSYTGGAPVDMRASSGPRRNGRGGSRGRRAQRYAALDLGTNNCRLLVAEPLMRGFRVVDAFSRIIRLGEGLGTAGRLNEAAMDRAISALKVCKKKLDDRGVHQARLIATEACRSAANGEMFLDRVTEETGLSLEIVDRETEARLAVAGCATLVDPQAEGVVLFDIGGGSSEIVWLDLRRRETPRLGALVKCIRSWMSLPVGVVSLSERHGGRDVTPYIFEAMVADVADQLGHLPEVEELDSSVTGGRVHMLGTSGTVTTLAGVHLNLERYDRRRVDGAWMSAAQVDSMTAMLLAMDFDQRVANPCIGADRADLVLAGCAILEAFRRRWPCERLRVADRGLREGILVELMVADRVWVRRRRHRRSSRPDLGRAFGPGSN